MAIENATTRGEKSAMSMNLPARHVYAAKGDAMLEVCNHAGERIAVVYTTPGGVGIDAANPGQFFSVYLYDTSTDEAPRPDIRPR